MGEMEEMKLAIGNVQKDVSDIKQTMPAIARALADLTLINDRQGRDKEEHQVFWTRLEEHSSEICDLKLQVKEIETKQTECLKRQGFEQEHESAKHLQDRGTFSNLAVYALIALVSILATLAAMHGSTFVKQ